jgi:hypothetical protein
MAQRQRHPADCIGRLASPLVSNEDLTMHSYHSDPGLRAMRGSISLEKVRHATKHAHVARADGPGTARHPRSRHVATQRGRND